MTLHESIKQKIADGWTDTELAAHYRWVSEQNFTAVLRDAKRALKAERLRCYGRNRMPLSMCNELDELETEQ